MAKTSYLATAKICIAMARQPNKRFSSIDFLHDDISLRTIQRHLKQLENDGVIVSDGNNPRGYKLAFNTQPKL